MIHIRANRRFRTWLAVPLLMFFIMGISCSGGIRHVTPPAAKQSPRPDESESEMFRKWSAASVLTAITDSGLEAERVTRGVIVGPPGAKDNIIFIIPSYGENTGGLIAGFDTEKALLDAWVYFLGMNLNREKPAWRIYRRDNILLLISGLVPEEQSVKYLDALDGMKVE